MRLFATLSCRKYSHFRGIPYRRDEDAACLAEGFGHRIGDGLLVLGSVKHEWSKVGVVPIKLTSQRILEITPCHMFVPHLDGAEEGPVVDVAAGATEKDGSSGPELFEGLTVNKESG